MIRLFSGRQGRVSTHRYKNICMETNAFFLRFRHEQSYCYLGVSLWQNTKLLRIEVSQQIQNIGSDIWWADNDAETLECFLVFMQLTPCVFLTQVVFEPLCRQSCHTVNNAAETLLKI
jgi:hypothetical protein